MGVPGSSLDRRSFLSGFEIGRAVGSTHRFGAHTHDSFVIQAVDAGAVAFECEGRTWCAGPGELIVIAPEVAHTGRPAGGRSVSYRTLYPDADVFARARGGAPDEFTFTEPAHGSIRASTKSAGCGSCRSSVDGTAARR